MSLSPGRTLSHYRLVAPIGEGGMGVVWRASDSALGRDVAIKVLPEFLAGDPERMARFEREARLLASLNHPHIASIYGFHEDGGVRFLAMELVDGEDLAQRLERGPIPTAEVLPLALQVAQALEHAHEKGVIHRDLKPANVKLTAGGQAKVLDFGLAKALEDEPGRAGHSASMSVSPTITGHLTSANVLLGTAAYMAPEQARGQVADRRADIWGFGVLVMEMLTGRRTFQGETISDTLASVLKTDPDWSALPPDTPARLRWLLRRCLERDPKRRLRDIGEARILLEDLLAGREGETPAALPAARPAGWPIARVALATAAALVLGGALAFAVLRVATPRPALPLRKFQLTVAGPDAAPHEPTLSPDGRRVAYLFGPRLVIQALDELEPRSFAVETGASRLFWAPDSRHVGYIAGTRIFKLAIDGSEPTVICDTRGAVSSGGWGACWTAADMVVFSRGDSAGLMQVPAGGGDPRNLLRPDSSESDLHEPGALPGGRGLVFPAHRRQGGVNTLWLYAGGRRRLLLELPGQTISNPQYSSTGHILFRRSPTTPGIWALPFSLSRLAVTGPAFLVAPGGTNPTVAGEGTLCYLAGSASAPTQATWVDSHGAEVGTIGQPEENSNPFVSLSPDGRRVIRSAQANDNRDLFILDAERGTRTRLTFSPGSEDGGTWSPDGRRVAYFLQLKGFSGASGFYALTSAADGTGVADTIAANGVSPRYSPDGRKLLYIALRDNASHWDLCEADAAPPHASRLLVQGNPWVEGAAVAPAGDLLAYMSTESGQWEVFLTRYPSCEGKWQVSTSGGQWPSWSANGDRLYFAQGDDAMAVAVTHGPAPTLGSPVKLFTRPPLAPWAFGWVPNFEVSRSGDRFVVLRAAGRKGAGPAITLVQDWIAEFHAPPK